MNNRDIDGKVIQYHTQKDEIKRLKSGQELLILLIIALTFSTQLLKLMMRVRSMTQQMILISILN